MLQKIRDIFEGKKVLILGYGREGRSSMRLMDQLGFSDHVYIADANIIKEASISTDRIFFGERYLAFAADIEADIVLKSPGIPMSKLHFFKQETIRSQSSVLMEACGHRIIGITGTKGKSTTSSLIYHILKESGKKALLGGNIGIPPFDLIEEMDQNTWLVYELSSHQLETVRHSPYIAILLNLYEEHLDHYASLEDYHSAKVNILRFQKNGDFALLAPGNYMDPWMNELSSQVYVIGEKAENALFYDDNKVYCCEAEQERIFLASLPEHPLCGEHNQINVLFALMAAKLAGVDEMQVSSSLSAFKVLPHRLEDAGTYAGIRFIDDSISTIPEATIAALKGIPEVNVLILGGYDRGISYDILKDYLFEMPVPVIVFLDSAGERMMHEFGSIPGIVMHYASSMEEAVGRALEYAKGGVCLLSPAAASYGRYRDFQERGDDFQKWARALTGPR